MPAEHVLAYITSAYADAHLISPELFRSYSTGTAALQPGSWDVPQQQTEALTPQTAKATNPPKDQIYGLNTTYVQEQLFM